MVYGAGVVLAVPFAFLMKKHNHRNFDNLNIVGFVLCELILIFCVILHFSRSYYALYAFSLFFGIFFNFFLQIAYIQLIKSNKSEIRLYSIATLCGFISISALQIQDSLSIIILSIGILFFFMVSYVISRRNLKIINFDSEKLRQKSKEKFQLTKEEFYARFTFIEHIQNGVQASVFKYLDTLLNNFVAVKIFVSHQQEKFENQQRELNLLKTLKDIENTIIIYHYVLH